MVTPERRILAEVLGINGGYNYTDETWAYAMRRRAERHAGKREP